MVLQSRISRVGKSDERGSASGGPSKVVHGEEFRRPATGRQRERGSDAEVDRCAVEEHPGDRGRGGGLLEEGFRGRHGGSRKAVRREVLRQGGRSADRIRQGLL